MKKLSPENVEVLIDKRLSEVAQFIFSRSQEKVASFTDTGELLQSGFMESRGLGKIVVGYRAEHASYLEYGTPPHMPPVSVIRAWAGRKGLGTGDELDRISWAIAKTIEKNGVEAKPFLRPSLDEAVARFKKF